MWTAIYHRVFGWVKEHRNPVNDLHRRQITVETHTMTIIRPSHSCRWCRKCAREAPERSPAAELLLPAVGNQPAHRPRNDSKAGTLTEPRLGSNSGILAASRLAENIPFGHRQARTQNNQLISTAC